MKNYFIYLPNRKAPDPWECIATSVGYSKIMPCRDYPPLHHPVDHHFTWANGRVLQAYQIIYISEGCGVFESESTTKRLRVPEVFSCFFPESGIVMHRTRKPVGRNIGSNAAAAVSTEPEKLDRSPRNVRCCELVLFRTCFSAMTGAMASLNDYRREAKHYFRRWAYTFYRSFWKQPGSAGAYRCTGITLSKALSD
jgi:hypothetical protein